MVKLSDNRFAILYTTQQGSKRPELHYLVVSDTGEEIYSGTYTGLAAGGSVIQDRNAMLFTESNDGILDYSCQPVVYNGSIIWTSPLYTYVVKNGKEKNKTRVYSIPIVY